MKKLAWVYNMLVQKQKLLLEYWIKDFNLYEEIDKIGDILHQCDTLSCSLQHKQFINKLCDHHCIGLVAFLSLNEITKRYYYTSITPSKQMKEKVKMVLRGDYQLPYDARNIEQLLTYQEKDFS